MISSPLFIKVALSTVIFLPICHFGCASASLTVAFFISSTDLCKKGPPEAVIINLSTCEISFMHWWIAQCSLSTGIIFTPCFFASLITISPAITRVSLFASAIFMPFFIAVSVGRNPILPEHATNIMSFSLSEQIFSRPCSPRTVYFGLNFFA